MVVVDVVAVVVEVAVVLVVEVGLIVDEDYSSSSNISKRTSMRRMRKRKIRLTSVIWFNTLIYIYMCILCIHIYVYTYVNIYLFTKE